MKEIYKLCISQWVQPFFWKGIYIPSIRYIAIIDNLIDYHKNASLFPFHKHHIYKEYCRWWSTETLRNIIGVITINNYYTDFKYLLKNHKMIDTHSYYGTYNVIDHILHLVCQINNHRHKSKSRFIIYLLKNYHHLNINHILDMQTHYTKNKVLKYITKRSPHYLEKILNHKHFMHVVLTTANDPTYFNMNYTPLLRKDFPDFLEVVKLLSDRYNLL